MAVPMERPAGSSRQAWCMPGQAPAQLQLPHNRESHDTPRVLVEGRQEGYTYGVSR